MLVRHKKNTIDCRASVLKVREDGILYLVIKPNMEFGKKDVDDVRFAIEKLGKTIDMLMIVDVRENTTGDKDVREYGAKYGAAALYAKAVAYVTNSLAQKIIINFFINFFPHKHQIKMFGSVEKAADWLKKQQG